MQQQQDLLAPSRERQYAQLQNQLFQTGRGGLSVGATGLRPSGAGGLGATTPEMEAYYNALAQQDYAVGFSGSTSWSTECGFWCRVARFWCWLNGSVPSWSRSVL
jgi:hypothetical protein